MLAIVKTVSNHHFFCSFRNSLPLNRTIQNPRLAQARDQLGLGAASLARVATVAKQLQILFVISSTFCTRRDVVNGHILKWEVNATALAIPRLLAVQHMLVRPVIGQFLDVRAAREVCSVDHFREFPAFQQSIFIGYLLQSLNDNFASQRA